MILIHGSVLLFKFVIVGLALSGMFSAMNFDEMNQVFGDAVLSALESARITIKEAVAIMAVDESQFRKALRGEGYRHVSLNHLLKLPFSFWLHFSPTLMYLVAKKNMVEIAETVGLRKSA